MGAVRTDLHDVPKPTLVDPGVTLLGPPISPKARISLYSDVEWEEFVLEWVCALDENYVQIKRFGGAGDKGADIAAFKTVNGLEGAWDCFQCKHYAAQLALSDILPEILKIILATLNGNCVFPDSYQILAPRGCSTPCGRTLSSPEELKRAFLEKVADGVPLVKGLKAEQISDIRAYAEGLDFSRFKSVELDAVLQVHGNTPWHAARFATALRPRPAALPAPDEPAVHETRYVQQLVEVFAQRFPAEGLTSESIASNSKVGESFRRHRETFYKAESLRLYARDSVPPGTFEKLQDDIYGGVVDTLEGEHPSAHSKMTSVLGLVGQLDLNRHRLITVAEIDDRKGICHQLANVDRIVWVTDG